MWDQIYVDLDKAEQCAVEAKVAVVRTATDIKEAVAERWNGFCISFDETEEALAEKARDAADRKVDELRYRRALRELREADASYY